MLRNVQRTVEVSKVRYIDRSLNYQWNADADNVCDVQWAYQVRGSPPWLVSVIFETRDAS